MHTGGVDAGIWGIVAVLVIGTGVVAYGWLSDRSDDRRRAEAMQQPPEREIPRFRADEVRPRYLSELEAVARPDDLPSTDLGDQVRARLKEALPGSPSFAVGWPNRAYITDAGTSWCVVNEPVIAICSDEITTMRELLPAVKRARESTRPLIVVAPAFSEEVLATLRANWVQATFNCLPIRLPDDRRRSLGSLTGAQPVSASDLQAGYLPTANLGTCLTWVSDQRTSWVLIEAG